MLLGLVTDLQFTKDAGFAQAEVSWQLPQAPSEDVQVPENLSDGQRGGGGGLVKHPIATSDIPNNDMASRGQRDEKWVKSPNRNMRLEAMIIFNQLISGHPLSHGCQW